MIALAAEALVDSQAAEGIFVVLSQLGTLYYFGFFLVIMPVLGLIEKPTRIPNSITEAVLEKEAARKKPAGSGV